MISVCITSCSCAKDAPHLLHEFDAAQTQNPPPKRCLPHMLLGYISVSSEGRRFRNENPNNVSIFELKTGGRDVFLGCKLH